MDTQATWASAVREAGALLKQQAAIKIAEREKKGGRGRGEKEGDVIRLNIGTLEGWKLSQVCLCCRYHLSGGPSGWGRGIMGPL